MEGEARRAALSLGGNQGDVEASFRMALEALADAGLEGLRASSLYVTKPVGCEPGAPDFLNAAAIGLWRGSPLELLSLCKALEERAGRPGRHPRWHSRPLDIDIVSLGDMELKTEKLTLPHPEALRRRFVAEPLAEIAPDLVLPGFALTMSQALQRLLFSSSAEAPLEVRGFAIGGGNE